MMAKLWRGKKKFWSHTEREGKILIKLRRRRKGISVKLLKEKWNEDKVTKDKDIKFKWQTIVSVNNEQMMDEWETKSVSNNQGEGRSGHEENEVINGTKEIMVKKERKLGWKHVKEEESRCRITEAEKECGSNRREEGISMSNFKEVNEAKLKENPRKERSESYIMKEEGKGGGV